MASQLPASGSGLNACARFIYSETKMEGEIEKCCSGSRGRCALCSEVHFSVGVYFIDCMYLLG